MWRARLSHKWVLKILETVRRTDGAAVDTVGFLADQKRHHVGDLFWLSEGLAHLLFTDVIPQADFVVLS